MPEIKKYKKGQHPNSLAALGRAWTSEEAKLAQQKGADTRSRNATKRKEMRESLQQWRMMKNEVLSDDISAVDTLKMLLAKAIYDEQFEVAADLAGKLAEYEKPKLARREVKVEEVKADDMSDEELNARLRKLLDDSNS